MRTSTLFSLLVLATMFASTAGAQQIAPAGVRLENRISQTGAPFQVEQRSRAEELPVRFALGAAAAVAGGYAGIAIAQTLPHHQCNCDDPGLEEAVVGGALMSVIGSAVFAALPSYDNSCSYGKRVALGLAGSAVGAVAGGFIGSRIRGEGVLIGYLGGAGLGSGLASSFCK